jgi:chemotaxis family two-component system response regulator Rcp1
MRIVIVEDNPSDVFLIKEAILAQGLTADLQVVEDGEEAIGLIAQVDEDINLTCPDLMLLDLNLPKTDGFVVLERLRRSARCAQIPVIVMTSSSTNADRQRGKTLRANAYFQKPSSYEEFLKLGHIIEQFVTYDGAGNPTCSAVGRSV